MRCNLVLQNIAESAQESTLDIVFHTLVQRLKIPRDRIKRPGSTLGDVSLDIAHRIGKWSVTTCPSWPIVFKLVHWYSKDEILKFTKNLRQSPISVSEQHPDQIWAKRTTLFRDMKKNHVELVTKLTSRLRSDSSMVNLPDAMRSATCPPYFKTNTTFYVISPHSSRNRHKQVTHSSS